MEKKKKKEFLSQDSCHDSETQLKLKNAREKAYKSGNGQLKPASKTAGRAKPAVAGSCVGNAVSNVILPGLVKENVRQ